MSYKVIGALAVCETPAGNKDYLYKDAPVPDDTVNLQSLLEDGLVAKEPEVEKALAKGDEDLSGLSEATAEKAQKSAASKSSS